MIIEHACPFLYASVNTSSAMNNKNRINSDTHAQGCLNIGVELITTIQKETTKQFGTGKKTFTTGEGIDFLSDNRL